MARVMVEGVGWVYIVLVLNWYTKKIAGDYVGIPCTARHWLAALELALHRQFPDGARGQGLSLMRDNGCQPTSLAFMQACVTLEIHQAFTSYNNLKANADLERFMRTLKEEWLWLEAGTCPFTPIRALAVWIMDYNEHYLYSALGSETPKQCERDSHSRTSPPFLAA
jgi:putative transposase